MVALELGDIREPGSIFLHPVKAALLAGEIIFDEGSSDISRPRAPPVKKVNAAFTDNRLGIVGPIKPLPLLSRPAVPGRLPGKRLIAPLAVPGLNKEGSPARQGDLISV